MGASTIINTLSSEIANSYCDVSYADAYWANDYRIANATQWAALSTPQKTGVLIDACRIIETMRFTLPFNERDYVTFYDRKTHLVRLVDRNRRPYKWIYAQKLQFPRNLDVYVLDTPAGAAIGDNYIPQDILEAQCEQAMYLLNFDDTTYAAKLMGLTQDSVGLGKGDITTEQTFSLVTPTMVAPRTMEKCRPYLVRSNSMQRC